MRVQEKSLFFLMIFILSSITKHVTSLEKLVTFSDEPSKFNRLVVDREGRVFIGAVNKLYQLSPDLQVIAKVTTGPNVESLKSRPGKQIDNYNKILVIDYVNSRLISCGSNSQGSCDVYDHRNINNKMLSVPEPVVSNDENESCVAFTAYPEPQKTASSYTLYVGVTYNGNSTRRSKVPVIAARSLEKDTLLKIIKWDGTIGTNISVNSRYRDKYAVNYIYGFDSGPYKYFLIVTSQTNSTTGLLSKVSKIVRICDTNSNLYMEIPILCVDENKKVYDLAQVGFFGKAGTALAKSLDSESQDDVLFAVFTQSEQSEDNASNKPNNHSALCAFSLNSINNKFLRNIQNCMAGKGLHSLESIPPDKPCNEENNITFDSHFCWINVNMSVTGEKPIQKPVLKTFNSISTAIHVATADIFTVVFIGTYSGHLKKITLKGLHGAVEYADEPTEEESKVNSLQLDPNGEHLYVLTDHTLSKIRVYSCHDYQTDVDCLEADDPYCGWCISENKCTLRDRCLNAKNDSLLWVPYNFKTQLSITGIDPEFLPRYHFKNLTLKVQNLPSFNENPWCVFIYNHKPFVNTSGTLVKGMVHCLSPNPDIIPWTLKNPITRVKVSIRTNNITNIISSKYSFSDCNMSNSCLSCTKYSKFKCHWLATEHSCVYNSSPKCNSDASENNLVCKPNHCPIVNIIGEASSVVFIPDGIQKTIKAKISKFRQFDTRTQQQCRFTIEERIISVNATSFDYKTNMITCEEIDFTYALKVPNTSVTFAVMRDNSEDPIAELDKTNLVIFKCRHMANNCEACLDLDKQYGCGWCEGSNQCEIETQCDKTDLPLKLWLSYGDVCFIKPSVLHFTPKSGPYEGGTNVTIRNSKIDCSFPKNKVIITVSGTSCEPIIDSCIRNESIACQINKAISIPNSDTTQGPVIVRMQGLNITSETNYTIVDPKIYGFSPRQGSQTGGTELTVQGKYLDAGSSVEVFINDLPCNVFFRNSAVVKCLTIATKWKIRGHVILKFSGTSRIFDEYMYHYISVYDLPSDSNNMFVPQGTPQGGNLILFHDKNLKSIFKVTIRVSSQSNKKNRGNFYDGECNVFNDTFMTCVSPAIPGIKNCSSNSNNVDHPKVLPYVFVKTMLNDTLEPLLKRKYSKFFLYCEPVYNSSWMKVHCYKSPQESMPLLWRIVCVLVTALFFAISVLLFYKKCTRSAKVMEKMRGELDRLELCVAAECKEAFAELQTEISDSRISGMPDSLPFWDYRTYVMKILFPNIQDHSAILCDKPELMGKEKQLRSFHQLITNKTFLMLFIKSLESFETFSMNDRVYVASMLMISLQNEMEYCTDITKSLLESLIEKYLRGTIHPKLLLRRTDSIVEKMLSAWLSFLMYKFLQECAGKPLFTLFKGIKQQVNKGPIDEITSEARYSLNEEKLIRQHIDYHTLTVYVSVPRETAHSTGLESAVENIPIKVLDCDTISQAKEKAVNGIYFAVNYSKRPKPTELDFILETDSSNGKILSDDDASSEIEGEWKRRNTLHHYEVIDGSKLNLELLERVPHSCRPSVSFHQEQHVFSCEKLKTTIIECASPKMCRAKYKIIPESDAYYKEWHLVKPNHTDDHHIYQDGNNMMSEIYLTRLLSTKCTLQKFVDNLFEVILSNTRQSSCFPVAIKYMFDFLDNQASEHAITDPEVVHTWKNNCLPLRFWVNLIKNPDFLFDIHKSSIIDSCLSVVAQAFMDSCSIGEHCLGKDSPTSKLLYAKDIPFYKEWVKKYYADIKAMPSISRENMNAVLAKESQLHFLDFNTNAATYELYKYAVKYKDRLIAVLRDDESSQKFNLAVKLKQVFEAMAAGTNLV